LRSRCAATGSTSTAGKSRRIVGSTQVRTRPFGVVVLAPDAEAVAKREAERRKTAYKDGWTIDGLNTELHTNTAKLGLWLDTSNLTPHQTVDEILVRLPETLIK
jgi:chloramphenicol 3-O-phosphotransferase